MSTYAERYAASPGGVPNPYHARVNPWRGGDYNEGNLYHGPNYDEPMFTMPNQAQPIWQSGPPGTAGIGEYNMYDVNTRGGSFSPKGYGGGIFNLNTALGDDVPVIIWGVPNPAFVPVQVKLNARLVANGLSPVPMDGVTNETFCAGGRSLVTIPGQFEAFLASLTPYELTAAQMAIGQCCAGGLLNPALLPCGFPGSTNPNCGGQPPGTTCPPGTVWNQAMGMCVPSGVTPPAASCPAGTVNVNGVCIPRGVLPPTPQTSCPPGTTNVFGTCVPNIVPPQPQTSCPAGSTLIGGVCIPNGVIPPQPQVVCPPGSTLVNGVCVPNGVVPPTTCPAGQVWDPTVKACVKTNVLPVGPCPAGQNLNANGQCVPTPAAPADKTSLYMALGLGAVAVGVAAYFMTRKK